MWRTIECQRAPMPRNGVWAPALPWATPEPSIRPRPVTKAIKTRVPFPILKIFLSSITTPLIIHRHLRFYFLRPPLLMYMPDYIAYNTSDQLTS